MKIKYFITIISIVLTSFTSGTSKKCRSVDDAVKQTINALQKRDINLYLEMWDKEKFIVWVKENPNEDSNELIKKADEFKAFHENNFNTLLKQLKAQFGNKKTKIKYISHKVDGSEKENGVTNYFVEIIFVIENTSKRISTPMSEYKGCVYFFEPIGDFIAEL